MWSRRDCGRWARRSTNNIARWYNLHRVENALQIVQTCDGLFVVQLDLREVAEEENATHGLGDPEVLMHVEQVLSSFHELPLENQLLPRAVYRAHHLAGKYRGESGSNLGVQRRERTAAVQMCKGRPQTHPSPSSKTLRHKGRALLPHCLIARASNL